MVNGPALLAPLHADLPAAAHVTSPIAALACLALVAALLVAAAIGDARHRLIPNRLCAAVALLALAYWPAATTAPLGPLATQAVLALAVGIVLVILFAIGVFGGGDVKLLAALMLWIRPVELPAMLMITALCGGLLGMVLIVHARLRRRPLPSVPYGIAIALGALPIIADRAISLLR